MGQQQQHLQQQVGPRRRPSSASAGPRRQAHSGHSNGSIASARRELWELDEQPDPEERCAPFRAAWELEDENEALRALAEKLRQELSAAEERGRQYQEVVAEMLCSTDMAADGDGGFGDRRDRKPSPRQPRLAMFRQAADGGDCQWNR